MAPYRSTPEAAPCPACSDGLQPRLIGCVSLLECGTCGGAYIARSLLFEMIKTRDAATAQALIEAYGHQPPPEVGLSAVVYRRCPTCAKMMTRTQFAKGAKVIISDH